MNEPTFTAEQLARRYSVSNASIRNWAKWGQFPPAFRMSPCMQWKQADVVLFETQAREAARAGSVRAQYAQKFLRVMRRRRSLGAKPPLLEERVGA